jgi:F0F1-type ATP synthase membrane subunit b/b'
MKDRPHRLNACELKNKVAGARAGRRLVSCLAALLLVVAFGGFTAAHTVTQPEHPPAPAGEHAQGAEEHAEGEEHGMFAGLMWPVLNFAILAGGLWWFFREPFATYLRDRHQSIRQDLVDAANVKSAAAAQLAELERKLQALPGEIDALRSRGAEEIASEERRIAAAAAAERERLLEQTRREIDVQVRLAKRDLVEHAATLAVQLAGDRLRQQITSADQDRLVTRYAEQVGERTDSTR